jgi:hypothetical protein
LHSKNILQANPPKKILKISETNRKKSSKNLKKLGDKTLKIHIFKQNLKTLGACSRPAEFKSAKKIA